MGQDDGYVTLYHLWFRNGTGSVVDLGEVKIGYADLIRGERPLDKGAFSELSGLDHRLHWFSVGQNDAYYENIRKLGASMRQEILSGLCDMAFDNSVFQTAMQWDVTHTSLLRSIEPRTVAVQFRRIAWGGPRLTEYCFDYVGHATESSEDGKVSESCRMSFSVQPHAQPPTNVHVLVGRNGAGKTTLLGNITKAVLHPAERSDVIGRIEWRGDSSGSFVNVVCVTFSAFDPAQEQVETEDSAADPAELKGWDGTRDVIGGQSPPPAEADGSEVSYRYVGLAQVDELGRPTRQRKSHEHLTREFAKSVEEVIAAGRSQRWLNTLDTLGSDPHFFRSPVRDFAQSLHDRGAFRRKTDHGTARNIFSNLSSGHAIVLLTITRLVETVAEQSLVLLDEPEAHLHPPLLASFVRALSDLLTDRNAVAVLSTHSPVVLQEVPRSCVWKVTRQGQLRPERPAIETYGENVGVLTHEIFGLEVRQSGFHAEIEKAVRELGTYERVLARFDGQLGGEAKGLVRILLAYRAAQGRP
ncbi:hypothetical protein DKG71_00960 [Streptomyces sp. NEAU-S7GS2]|nr:hypothetical protein DKG71_00960 [Streptomyces sp. NEAU-S7GS2]